MRTDSLISYLLWLSHSAASVTIRTSTYNSQSRPLVGACPLSGSVCEGRSLSLSSPPPRQHTSPPGTPRWYFFVGQGSETLHSNTLTQQSQCGLAK